ncbi:MAG: 2-phosphosulfolactate phosphatase, partial [Bacteroidota bacterium]
NISRVVDFLLGTGGQIALLCAGRSTDGFSLEDTLCGGMIVSKLLEEAGEVEFTDSSLMALTLYKKFGRNILKALRTSEHGRYLMDLGFEDDIKLCAGVDTVPVLPTLEGNVIRRLKTVRRRTKELRNPDTVGTGS